MFDPAPIHRDMQAVFEPMVRQSEAWPPAKVRSLQDAVVPSIPRPKSRRLRLILPPLLVAAMLIGFLGGSALDRVGIGHSIRSAISQPATVRNPLPSRTAPAAMIAIPVVQPKSETTPKGLSAAQERQATGAPPARYYSRWRRARWQRRQAEVSTAARTDEALQREIEEDAVVTRRLNVQALTSTPPHNPTR